MTAEILSSFSFVYCPPLLITESVCGLFDFVFTPPEKTRSKLAAISSRPRTTTSLGPSSSPPEPSQSPFWATVSTRPSSATAADRVGQDVGHVDPPRLTVVEQAVGRLHAPRRRERLPAGTTLPEPVEHDLLDRPHHRSWPRTGCRARRNRSHRRRLGCPWRPSSGSPPGADRRRRA